MLDSQKKSKEKRTAKCRGTDWNNWE